MSMFIQRTPMRFYHLVAGLLVTAAALVTPAALTRIAAAETHFVTATGSRWYYRDGRSGIGEHRPVQLEAAPGDEIAFRQTDGRHGVFFYTTPRGLSELGRAIDVEARITVIRGEFEGRLTNRLFMRENLTTAEFEGPRHLLTIRLADGFDRPLFFGCRVHSVLNRGTMFGLIRPAARPRAKSRTGLPAAWQSAVSPVSAHRETATGWQSAEIVPRRITLRQLLAGQPGEQWFQRVPRLRPDTDRATWSYATLADIDGDRDDDVVAFIKGPDSTHAWWLLESPVANARPFRQAELAFAGAVRLTEPDAPASAHPEEAFALPGDFNLDGRTDLGLYNGNRQGKIEFAMNHPNYRKSVAKREEFVFQQDFTLDCAEQGLTHLTFASLYDADFDGWPDLLVAAEQSDAVIFFNSSPGVMSGAYGVRLPGTRFRIQSVTWQDFDGDRRPDLVISGPAGRRELFYNEGERRFTHFEPRDR